MNGQSDRRDEAELRAEVVGRMKAAEQYLMIKRARKKARQKLSERSKGHSSHVRIHVQ